LEALFECLVGSLFGRYRYLARLHPRCFEGYLGKHFLKSETGPSPPTGKA
jgi:hypothetical protein